MSAPSPLPPRPAADTPASVRLRAGAAVALVALVGAAAACGGTADRPAAGNGASTDAPPAAARTGAGAGTTAATAPPAPAEAVEHVHGLGVDPGDGAVLLATHTGLFRLAPGNARPERVGRSTQDTMGFTVVGAGRYMGSGHPAPGGNGPAHLGLIASEDGGLTWRSVSLAGEADFHLLREAGDRIVAADSLSGDLFVSDDGGRTWRRGAPPEDLIDLAIDPADPDHLVATTGSGGAVSRDAGSTWSATEGAPGYLAWPAPGRLVRLGEGGAVALSGDGGRSWRPTGSLGEVPAAFAAGDGGVLLAATHDGRLRRSADLGATWTTAALLT